MKNTNQVSLKTNQNNVNLSKEKIKLIVNNVEYKKTPPKGKLVLVASNGKIIEEALNSLAA